MLGAPLVSVGGGVVFISSESVCQCGASGRSDTHCFVSVTIDRPSSSLLVHPVVAASTMRWNVVDEQSTRNVRPATYVATSSPAVSRRSIVGHRQTRTPCRRTAPRSVSRRYIWTWLRHPGAAHRWKNVPPEIRKTLKKRKNVTEIKKRLQTLNKKR